MSFINANKLSFIFNNFERQGQINNVQESNSNQDSQTSHYGNILYSIQDFQNPLEVVLSNQILNEEILEVQDNLNKSKCEVINDDKLNDVFEESLDFLKPNQNASKTGKNYNLHIGLLLQKVT